MNLSYLEPGKANVSYVTGSHNVKIGTQWNSMANIVETQRDLVGYRESICVQLRQWRSHLSDRIQRRDCA